MWYRVFCRSAPEVKPAELLAEVQLHGRPVAADFKGDDLGWTRAEFRLGNGSPVYAERYLTKEDNLREDLNTWAGWLETQDFSPNHVRMMEHVIQTQQLVTLRKPIDHPDDAGVDSLCEKLCQVLAAAADGMYQVEGDAWYSATGEELLKEY